MTDDLLINLEIKWGTIEFKPVQYWVETKVITK